MTTTSRTHTAVAPRQHTTPIRVAIADDHDLMRVGLRALLSHRSEIDIIWEAISHKQVGVMMDLVVPDIMLIDPRLGNASTWHRLRVAAEAGMVVILLPKPEESEPSHPHPTGWVLRLDAQAGRGELERVMRLATALPPKAPLCDPVPESNPANGPEDGRILTMVAAGRTNRQIAGALGVGEEAVKATLRELFARWQVASRSAAVVKAIELGVIE